MSSTQDPREKETRQQGPQNFKEEIYERIKIPIPVLDVIIAACIIGFVAILVFCRTK